MHQPARPAKRAIRRQHAMHRETGHAAARPTRAGACFGPRGLAATGGEGGANPREPLTQDGPASDRLLGCRPARAFSHQHPMNRETALPRRTCFPLPLRAKPSMAGWVVWAGPACGPAVWEWGSANVRRRQAVEAHKVTRGTLTRRLVNAVAAAALLLTSSCGTLDKMSNVFLGPSKPAEGQLGHVTGFLGGVVADEPRAALVGRDILSAGGNAADAAVAVGFALAVTLPSRAGLGGGGGCLAFAAGGKSINRGVPEAILFPPLPGGGGGERPAALPALARGLYLLHARYGHLQFESLIVPAEQLARFGVPTSKALAQDLSVVGPSLLADPSAASVFGHGGLPLAEGQMLTQPALAATLSSIRVGGVGDFYQGPLARRIANASIPAGGPMTFEELRTALPRLGTPLTEPYGRETVSFLPPPADGGLAAAAAFQVLLHDPNAAAAAQARGEAVVARWRAGNAGDPTALLSADVPGAQLPPLPASTSFITVDRDGNAVACALTMDNLFGTGRMLPGIGFLEAASPAIVPPPLLAAALAWNEPTHAFRAAVAGSGQNAAGTAVAVAMMNTLRTDQPMPVPVPEPGRANVGACPGYLPGGDASCGWATDPRGAGLAVSSSR
jgi:gamma-glutamyltranspeptidase/glutathione hydrolase